MSKTVFILLCALSPLFAAGRVESAQSRRGWIDAYVRDEQGKAIPDAMVTITNITNGEKQSHRTDKDGYWRFENVSAGTYTVTIEARGFGKLKQPDVEVNSGKGPNLRLTLARAQRPRDSVVAYIDSAIVVSQVRIRFEAAFNIDFPDRAEFFYGKCGCFRDLGDNHAPGPKGTPTELDFQHLYLYGEYALTQRFSLFAEVPVRWVEAHAPAPNSDPFPNEAGLSDVNAGFKLTAVASKNQYLTFQFRAYFPSGDSSKGLGTNHYSVEPALLYYRGFSERTAVEAQLGDRHPIGGSPGVPNINNRGFAGDVFFYGMGPSYVLYQGQTVRIAPVVEVVGWRVLGGLQTVAQTTSTALTATSADGTNIVNLKVGARVRFGSHSSFYLGYGRALTSAAWYSDIVRAEYRYSF